MAVDSKDILPYALPRPLLGGTETNTFANPAVVSSFGNAEQADLRQYWHIVKRRFWMVSVVPIAFVLLMGIRDVIATPLYTAQATILIKNNAPEVYAYTSMNSTDGPDEASSQWKVDNKTEYTLLQSRSLAEKVILAEGLATNPVFAVSLHGGTPVATEDPLADDGAGQEVSGKLIKHYMQDLKIEPIEDTELVAIGFTSPNPELSARLANAHVREFISQGIELNAQVSEEAGQFLRKKLAELKRQVEESELALNNYRRDKGIIPGLISLNGSQDVVLSRLDKINEQAQQAHLKNLNIETQVALIDQGHADALPGVIGSKVVQDLKENLDTLQAQYTSMSSQYKPDYPPMAELTAKIQGTQNAIKREIGNIVASIREQYAASLKDEQALNDELKGEKEFALGLNDAAVKYSILQREADTNQQLYNAVLKRMKDVEVTADLHASNVSVVDQATAPINSSSPQKLRDLIAAALLGLVSGVGGAFLLERHDNTFKDAEEVESYLRIPQLGIIPEFERTVKVVSSATRALPSRPPSENENDAPTIAGPGPRSAIGEAYRMVRTGLLLSRPGSPPKTALIASAIPGEGKSTTVANLAIVFASAGKRVLVIDADLRRPHCHDLFSMKNRRGLTEALTTDSNVEDNVRVTGFDNLFLLSSGETPPNPSELLGSDKMREVLSALCAKYDYIIIDSAPITAVTDAVILSSMVDGVVLVANRNTARQQVRTALASLEYARAKVFGVVLNQVDRNHFGYYGYKNHYYLHEYSQRSDSAAAG